MKSEESRCFFYGNHLFPELPFLRKEEKYPEMERDFFFCTTA
jgi:hypothetical protein